MAADSAEASAPPSVSVGAPVSLVEGRREEARVNAETVVESRVRGGSTGIITAEELGMFDQFVEKKQEGMEEEIAIGARWEAELGDVGYMGSKIRMGREELELNRGKR